MKTSISVAVDAAVFALINDELHVLLIRRGNPPFKGKHALPGGFVESDEELEDAVKRELEEETGVKNVLMKQLGAYGAVHRDPRDRVISIAYLGIVRASKKLRSSDDAVSVQWHPVGKIPPLAFDHKKIVEYALRQLRNEFPLAENKSKRK